MMRTRLLLIYDIPDDNTRGKIADICLDYGLDRVQYSAFVGLLSTTHRDELMLKIRKKLGRRPGLVAMVPVCERDWEGREEIHQEAASDA